MIRVWRTAALCALALTAAAAAASAQEQVFLIVRHAERVDAPAQTMSHSMMGPDPDLSTAGQARAKRLAEVLRDAGISRIFTTEYRRTRQTAAPLAERLTITPVMAAAKDTRTLLQQLRSGRGRTLVVGHSNTIPDILKGLGVSDTVTIAEQQYDDLFVVVRRVGGAATLLRLKY